MPKSTSAPWRCDGSLDGCVLENGSGVEAPTMGLNSSVGKGAMVPMAEETAHAKRAGKLKSKPRKEREKAVGNGVGTPGGGKS